MRFVYFILFLTFPFSLIAEDNWDFKKFDTPLKVTRGTANPITGNGFYFSKEESCRFAVKIWGWNEESCPAIDAFLVPNTLGIDTLIIETPQDVGYVKYDDWDASDRNKMIDQIWEEMEKSIEVQSRNLGQKWELIKWLVYPTLNKEKNYLYYVVLMNIDGTFMPAVEASFLDRYGYVKFQIIPTVGSVDADSSDAEFKKLVEESLSMYKPNIGTSYASYKVGDKVSEYGVLGV